MEGEGGGSNLNQWRSADRSGRRILNGSKKHVYQVQRKPLPELRSSGIIMGEITATDTLPRPERKRPVSSSR